MPKQNIITGQKIDPAKLQQAKALRRAMTPAEKRLWAALRTNRLDGFHFRRQQIIDGFIVDFYCHAAGLVVEVDGPVHEEQIEYDAERSRVLTARGLQTLRIKNEEIMHNLEDVLTRIRANLTPRPPSDPSPTLPHRGREKRGKGERSSPPLVGEGSGERSVGEGSP
jgi:very-short-patch-repair endonuclease